MKYRYLFILALCSCTAYLSTYGQLSLPTKIISGKDYYYYTVKAQETIYGISRQLNITKEDILKYNPNAKDGLKANQNLFFPVDYFSKDNKPISVKPVDVSNEKEFSHIVVKGETLYGISKTYNISQDDIIKNNPGTDRGIKTGQVLRIPQQRQVAVTKNDASETERTTNQNPKVIYITIHRGETLYSISKKYNTSIDRILKLNPGVSPTNFMADNVIKIIPNSAEPVKTEKIITAFIPYEVNKGDTYYSIAKNNNITVEELTNANPGVDKLKKGRTIYIPNKKKEIVLANPNAEIVSDNGSSKIKEIYDSIHVSTKNNINIALMLPYMLNEPKPSKQAKLYTEFYKGFLLAVDTMRKSSHKKINIYTYDTQNSLSVLNELLEKPEVKKMDAIFTPDHSDQISALATFGEKNRINIINAFSLKNEDYNTNSHLFQVNIPHSFLFAKVFDWFDETFSDYEVVLLNVAGGESKDIITDLKKHLKNSKTKVHNIELAHTLKPENINDILEPGKKYLFIPTSGSKRTLAKITPALKDIKNNRFDIDIAMLGYPEWGTYLSDYKNDFQKIDTYIYSRFFTNHNDMKLKSFENKYKKWYGENMMYAAPQFGLLGYDTGMFFLKAIDQNNNDFNHTNISYSGLQTDFDFQRISNWSGFINKSVYFIHFTPYSTIEKTIK